MKIIERLRTKLKLVLSVDRSPTILARSSALGVLIGISPYIGTHTYIAILLSGWFNLPIYPLMIGAYITNPITIAFVYGFTTKIGLILMGREINISFSWDSLTLNNLLTVGKTIFLPFIIGTHVVGLILAIITYFIVYFIAKRYQSN